MAKKQQITPWRVTECWFAENNDGIPVREMTLTIDHGDGTISMVVVPIDRMTVRMRKP